MASKKIKIGRNSNNKINSRKSAKRKVSKSSKYDKSSINKKLDQVLNMESNILNEEKLVENQEEILNQNEQKISSESVLLENLEKQTEALGEKEENDLAKLEKLEEEIKIDVGSHPLIKITWRDVIKGLVGAFVGLAVHYTFTYGVEISERLTVTRASFLYLLSFVVGLMFIYATGFRKIEDPKILMFMPVRLLILYITSIIMSIVVLLVFYPTFGSDLVTAYKMVGGVLLAAIIGACTADLIGKE